MNPTKLPHLNYFLPKGSKAVVPLPTEVPYLALLQWKDTIEEQKSESYWPFLYATHALSGVFRMAEQAKEKDPSKEIFAAVRVVLEASKEPQESRAVDALARALMPHLVALKSCVDLGEKLLTGLDDLIEDEMLWLDAKAAIYLEEKLRDKENAQGLRDGARERLKTFRDFEILRRLKQLPPERYNFEHWESLFTFWFPKLYRSLPIPEVLKSEADWARHSIPEYVFAFAHTLWKEEVKPQLVYERAKHQAIVRPVLEDLGRIYHAKGRKVQDTPEGPRLFDKTGEEIAILDLPPAMSLAGLEEAQRRVNLLRSLTGHKALRHQITEGHRRVLRGIHDPRRIEFKGGWSTYAALLGLNGNKAPTELADVVRAEAFTRFPWPNGKVGNLLALTEQTAEGRRPAEVVIILGDIILPDYYRALPKDGTRERQEQRQLIPIPPQLPPLVGRPNDHAAQAALQLQILGALRIRAEELAREGAAHLSWVELERLAERAELPKGLLHSVIERWTQGEDAFLEQKNAERYTLARSYSGSLEFLTKAGNKIIEGRKGGLTRQLKVPPSRRKK